MDPTGWIVGVGGVILGLIAAVSAFLKLRREGAAVMQKTTIDEWREIVGNLQAQIKQYEAERAIARQELAEAHSSVVRIQGEARRGLSALGNGGPEMTAADAAAALEKIKNAAMMAATKVEAVAARVAVELPEKGQP